VSFIALFCSFAISGCSILSHDERKYLARIEDTPDEFRVPPSEFDTCWSRAHSFIGTYSSRPILVMNDSIISTEWLGSRNMFAELFDVFDCTFGYRVTAHSNQSGILITPMCTANGTMLPTRTLSAARNARILIDYIKTDSLPFPELISK
jgi:hypothetical protein